MLFFPTTDEDAAYFRSQGYTGSIDDMHFKALGDLGYTGSLNDRIRACLTFKYGSYYEAMRDLRNGTSVFALSSYIINGFDPALVFDFKGDYFRKSATDSTFAASITHARASSATMMNSSGTLVTVGNNVPRTGHHIYNGSAWVNEGILHESEARTNLQVQSGDFSNSAWSKSAVTVDTSYVAPDGTSTASKFTSTGAAGASGVYDSNSKGTGMSLTCFMKAGSSGVYGWIEGIVGGASPYGVFDLVSGTVVRSQECDASIEPVGNGWFRCVLANTTNSISFFSVGGSDNTYTSRPWGFSNLTQDKFIYAWGAQLEAGPTPSSYIPTAGATATRAADLLTVPAASLPYDNTNMSIQMDGKMTGDTLTPVRWLLDANNSILLETGSNNFSFTQEAVGTVDTVTGGSFTSGTNVPFNLATRNGSTFINGAISGTALTANTTPTALPNLSSTDLNLGYGFMGTIGQFRMWSEDLTDVGIAEAST